MDHQDLQLSSSSSSPQALMKFCLLWTVLQRTKPPDVCNSVLNRDPNKFHDLNMDKVLDHHHEFTKQFKTLSDGYSAKTAKKDPQLIHTSAMNNHPFQYQFKHSSRSLSVIGVLGGIVLILFFVALSTCIKHRRNLNAFGDRYHHRENLAREMLVDHLRQIRTNAQGGSRRQNDRPPSYDDVVKTSEEDETQESEEPPSYIEATTTIIEEPVVTIPAENSTVVTVETTTARQSSPSVESSC